MSGKTESQLAFEAQLLEALRNGLTVDVRTNSESGYSYDHSYVSVRVAVCFNGEEIYTSSDSFSRD